MDRNDWLQTMLTIARPVIESLAERQLRNRMPVEQKTTDRAKYSHLEAFGRTMAGLAPWLETGPDEGSEGALRKRWIELTHQSVDAATSPDSPDFMNFSSGHQPIVDAAFFAHAILRAPNVLYDCLAPEVQRNVVCALKATRARKPFFNNWLLFSAMIESVLFRIGEDWDPMRIDYALKQLGQWYLGDGMYGDGPTFHMDYYNSFVIQPMLVDIIETVGDQSADWRESKERILERAVRYSEIQERSISPEGTFPVVGRSLAYRFGVFQYLAQAALQHRLGPHIHPAQVRCALSAVIRRMVSAQGTFDEDGWLQIGLCGHQPEIGENYISTGSLYLCLTVFLPLGLPEADPFWQGQADWTAKKAWSGRQAVIDHSI